MMSWTEDTNAPTRPNYRTVIYGHDELKEKPRIMKSGERYRQLNDSNVAFVQKHVLERGSLSGAIGKGRLVVNIHSSTLTKYRQVLWLLQLH